jgi:hypothetical protein
VNRFRQTLEGLEDRAVPAAVTVNTTLDVLGHDNGMLSLRQAIIDANAAPKGDIIIVPAGTYTLTRPGINENAGLTGDLDCSGDLTIRGAGAGTTTVDAAGLDRVFHVLAGGNVTLSGLTIKGGVDSAVDDSGLGILGSGGGIVNEGTLFVRDCTVSGNSAVGPSYADGGGIANFGTLTVSNSTLGGNSAGTEGGGIFNQGALTVRNSILSGNSANVGGGIGNDSGTATVSNSTLVGNSSGYWGGGIFNAGTLTVRSTTLSGNHSDYYGGGVFNVEGAAATFGKCAFLGNSAAYGGAVWNDVFATATVSNCALVGNSADVGGGILNLGMLTVRDSTLVGNWANDSGGGIYNQGLLTVGDCALSGNTATNFGGGIANWGTLTVRASTLVGNTASLGGDLYDYPFVSVSVIDSLVGVRYDA